MKSIIVTFDIEPDYPPNLGKSYMGIDNAIPRLLDILQSEKVPATFFLLAELCEPYPSMAREIMDRGFHLGNHGLHHSLLCLEDEQTQWHSLGESTTILERVSGSKITAFRAPNFSIGAYALTCLEKLGYSLDSSILPGRRMQRHLAGSVYDFRDAPRSPYHPSVDDVAKPGVSPVLEIPITENPLNRQAPIGAGFLNTYGPAETLKAIEMAGLQLSVLVSHPWEFVDLHSKFPNIPDWMKKGCRPNVQALSELFGGLRDHGYTFIDMRDVAKNPPTEAPKNVLA